MVIQPPEVMERDPNLENALIEPPHVARLCAPQQLQRFVLLEEFLPVELLDSIQQGIGWRVVAARGPAGRGFLDVRFHAEAWPAADARTVSPSGDAAGSSR